MALFFDSHSSEDPDCRKRLCGARECTKADSFLKVSAVKLLMQDLPRRGDVQPQSRK